MKKVLTPERRQTIASFISVATKLGLVREQTDNAAHLVVSDLFGDVAGDDGPNECPECPSHTGY